mgnify:CR=1 FL=1
MSNLGMCDFTLDIRNTAVRGDSKPTTEFIFPVTLTSPLDTGSVGWL